ncbi:MAG TPA: primosomal protein N' [Stellaceae bacterium]|nr:primosomal protein N' [Stellaceae bacterium]
MPPCHATLAGAQLRLPSAPAARCAVLLPLPLDRPYDYRVTADARLTPGTFVAVPLGRRIVPGVVWDGADDEAVPEERLKAVEQILDAPPLRPELRRFIDWVARYTMAPSGAVLRMAMSVPDALRPPRRIYACALSESGEAALRGDGDAKPLTPARQRVLAELADGPPRAPADLARAAGCGAGVVRGLLDLGLLRLVETPALSVVPEPDWRRPGPALAPDQAAAAHDLAGKVLTGGFGVTLLDGVTGSGKTQVYFAAIAAALERQRQALVLLPEIALGAQFLSRFAERFGAPPVLWHSDLTHAERRIGWRAVVEGRARVVVGARSALFLPFADLGLVVVDEEHDLSYKQEDGVVYHARDMAIVRARLAGIPVVLASATPSLETIVNVETGRYRRLSLPSRHAGALLPKIEALDLRRAQPERQRFLAPPLVAALAETLRAGEQALLFLNRRGYAPLTLCRACGHRLQCPNCTAWLIEHRFLGRLQCHHCGHAEGLPRYCPSCAAPGAFAACGPGVERLAEEVALRFPEARCAVMASDTLNGPRAAAQLVESVASHEIDILIGTQIVAKGHHFPMLTLVGVVDADLGLAGGDLRAAERTYQLLHQVAGRAGRAGRPGTVYLQTFLPEHPVIRALVSGDRDRFLAEEAAARRAYGMPPFGRLAALIVSAPDADGADAVAAAFARGAPQMPGLEVLGPAPAPLAVLRGRHRRRFLVKARRDVAVQPVLRDWLRRIKIPANARVQVDIDPYSFL